jgi:hypothetical protein
MGASSVYRRGCEASVAVSGIKKENEDRKNKKTS